MAIVYAWAVVLSVGRGIASSNAGGLAMQMSHGIFVAARLVLLRMLIEFFFEHMRDLRVEEGLQG